MTSGQLSAVGGHPPAGVQTSAIDDCKLTVGRSMRALLSRQVAALKDDKAGANQECDIAEHDQQAD